MKRTTIFLTDDIERLLRDTAQRTQRPQAEIVRDALTQYLRAQTGPWPRSVGMGNNSDPAMTSDNVSEWIRAQWQRKIKNGEADSDAGLGAGVLAAPPDLGHTGGTSSK